MYKKKSLWQSETNFFEAKDYFEGLLLDIKIAKHSIVLESYIFEHDALGIRVIESLVSARKRGVHIKVLVDGIGSMNSIDRLLKVFKTNDIAFKVYHPLPWNFRSYHYAIKKGGFFEKLLHFTGTINHRDHRKLCIIDNIIAWTGSYNISNEHLPREQGGGGWKDHGIRVSGGHVNILSEEFFQLWNHKRFKKLKRPIPFILSTLNPGKRKQKIRRMEQSIDSAKQRIWIENGYFAPHRTIIAALVRAKKRGVDVAIIVGGISDIIFFPSLTRSFYADLLSHGIGIYEWNKSVLHSKLVLIDNYCYSGSTNLNTRSHFHDLELDVLICLEPTIKIIEKQISIDFKQSHKIEFDYLFKNKFFIFFMGFFPRLLRYWL